MNIYNSDTHGVVMNMLYYIIYFISTLIKNGVVDDGAILQYRSSDLYLTDRKETMAFLQKGTHTPLRICK